VVAERLRRAAVVNGYGAQNLYGYDVELKKDGKTVSRKTGRYGYRKIEIKERPLDDISLSFVINVNGTDVFCKGSNWVPASNMTGTVEKKTYKDLVKAAAEADYNLLRVWGGGLYEDEAFYDACDELGVMVWQDFMFACSDIPDDDSSFRREVYREAEYQLLRLRNRPCVAVWCGGNERKRFLNCRDTQYGEYIWEVMLRGLHAKLTRCSAYVPNSPHSRTDIDMDYGSGDLHTSCYDPALIDDRICDYRDYLAQNKSPFTTECAILGSCRIRSLKKFIPADKLWPVNEIWHEHFMLNPYATVPEETFITKEFRLSEALFGKAEGLEDFVKKSMLVHYEIMKSEIEYARASDRCHGILNWMFNDIWGCGTWSVVDFYGEKKPVFYAQKAAFKPVCAAFWYDGENTRLSVFNDTAENAKLTVNYGQRLIGGETVYVKTAEIEVNKNSVYHFGAVDVADAAESYLFVTLGGKDKNIYFPRLWKGFDFKTSLTVNKENVSETEVKITVTANEFARKIFIDSPDNCGLVYEDNYFDMEKGETREITVKAERKLSAEEFTVKTYADVWDD